MRQRYGKGVMYNPSAVVYHKIFERMVRVGFLAKRAFWQGDFKAVMEEIAGNVDEISAFTLIAGVGYLYGKLS